MKQSEEAREDLVTKVAKPISLSAATETLERDGDAGRHAEAAGTSTLDLALRVIEYLVQLSRPVALTEIAAHFSASKATVYRHLVTLQRHGFASQEPHTGRYQAGIKLLVLGEKLRMRFDVLTAARAQLMELRDQTGHAVTLCEMVDEAVTVLELVQGHSIVDFGIRPGTRLAFNASAHGKIWLAFGPQDVAERALGGSLEAWTPSTFADQGSLRAELQRIREQGWSTAADEMITGVNALAAPIFDHANVLVGSVAVVGATQFIPGAPNPGQIAGVVGAASRISQNLGWRR